MFFLGFVACQLLIDFGTQYIKTTTIKNRKPDIVLDHQSKRKILNCIAYTSNLWVGNDCQSYLTRKPEKVAMSVKLLFPLLLNDPSTLSFYQSLFPVPISNNLVQLDQNYSVIDVFAILINQIQEYNDISAKAKDVYLILPHYYNYELKYKILQLSSILNCTITLLNENTMAMVQYAQSNQLSSWFELNKDKSQYFIIFDMGHYTTMSLYKISHYSTSVISSDRTMGLTIEAVANHFTDHGGFTIDLLIRDKLVDAFTKKYPNSPSITTNKRAMMQLLVESQKMKHVLSANLFVAISMEQLHDNKDFKHTMERSQLETLMKDIDMTTAINHLITKANVEPSVIQAVIVIGGTIRIPMIQDRLRAQWNDKINFQVDGDEGTAMGAAFYYMTQSPRFIMKPYNITDFITYNVYLNDTLIFPINTKYGVRKYFSFKRDEDYYFNLLINDEMAYKVEVGNVKWAATKVPDAIKVKTRIFIEINKSGLISVGAASYDAILENKQEETKEDIAKEEPEKSTEKQEDKESSAGEKESKEKPDDANEQSKDTKEPVKTPVVSPKPIKVSYPLKVTTTYVMKKLSDEEIRASQQRYL
eukprot:NODE_851_length_3703_cov_0.692564.p1 type:complete len:588 gc:universal NODE_851_length_3703_cov_0.692564:112-1875(+)